MSAPRAKGARGWRFPVRYRMPEKKDLAAYGLMTLAFGLMVGIAIGPALSTVSSAAQVIAGAPPSPVSPAADTPDDAPAFELGSPAGSEGDESDAELTASVGPPPAPSPAPAPAPVAVPPAADEPTVYADEDPGDATGDEPDPGDAATPLSGVVVGTSSGGRSYAVADRAGNLLAVHAGDSPAVGSRVSVGIRPLANGTFLQPAGREEKGVAKAVTVRGVITWIDPEAGRAALSARGVSLGLDLSALSASPAPGARAAALPDGVLLGARVLAKARIGPVAESTAGDGATAPEPASPRMRVASIEAESTAPAPLELNGPILEVDPPGHTATIAADGFGELDAGIEVRLPRRFDPGLIIAGGTYSVAAEALPDGAIRAIQVWANGSRREAREDALVAGP